MFLPLLYRAYQAYQVPFGFYAGAARGDHRPTRARLPPAGHPLAKRRSVPWTALTREPLIVLARREGMGLHDAVIAGCRQAGVTPRIAHTPSLIGTVMSYVEAGAGIGVVTESCALLRGSPPCTASVPGFGSLERILATAGNLPAHHHG